MFICGRKSFSNKERDKDGSYTSPHSTPKRSKNSKSRSKLKGNVSQKKNPYAERGLDEFYKLLADIEEKKQKIYSQIGVEEISFIRFVYSDSSEHIRPIVVRVKNKNSDALSSNHVEKAETQPEGEVDDQNEENGTSEEKKKDAMKKFNRRYYCFSVMVVFVLLFLAIYGRSFAILCATIMWYVVSGNLDVAHYHRGREGRRGN